MINNENKKWKDEILKENFEREKKYGNKMESIHTNSKTEVHKLPNPRFPIPNNNYKLY